MSAATTDGVAVPRLLFAGGGTAGHVNPALAVLPKISGACLWVGSVGGREEDLVRRAGIAFVGVPTGAVLGRGPLALARSAWRNAAGILAARGVIRRFGPSVVFATGGYVSAPPILAARTLGVPSAIFLPDVEPGLAVRVLARVVDRVACTADVTVGRLPAGKGVAVGYPVRADLRTWAARWDGRAAGRAMLGLPADTPVLLVVGGSQGARAINRAVTAALPRLTASAVLVHVAGPNGIAEARARRESMDAGGRDRYRVYEYVHEEMGAAMAAADLILSRAGASVLGELPAFGLPGLLVPGTFAGGHQRHNADYLAAAGAAVRIDEAELGKEHTLATTIESLTSSPDRLRTMREASRRLDRPDAAARIAGLLAELSREARS